MANKYEHTDYVQRARKNYEQTTLKENFTALRMKKELHLKLKELATSEGVSMTDMLNKIIEFYRSTP